MRKTVVMWAGAGAIAAAAGALMACGSAGGSQASSRPTAAQLTEGFNLIDGHDATWGMNGAYLKNGHVMYIETRVGALKPDVYRQTWPDDPPNETDMRFVDESGRTIIVQRGGDSFVDPSWNADIGKGMKNTPLSVGQYEAEFSLAQEAAAAASIALPAGFKDHVHFLTTFTKAAVVPTQNATMSGKIVQTAEQGYAWVQTSATALYSGNTGCFAWYCAAKHSATESWNYSGQIDIYSCNHGRCPWESGMGWQCQSYGPGGWISGETNADGNTGISGACQTGYNWDTPPGHECNDDAAYELVQTVHGNGGGGTYDVNGDGWHFNEWDSNGHNYACDCNNSYNGCSGDWSRPACP